MLQNKPEPDALTEGAGSSPSLEISNAIARLHKQYIGRGPTNSRTTIDGDLVVCLLEGGYTRAEQTLEDNNKGDLVAAARLGLQEAMRQAMVDVVEAVVGREVRSFMSANDLQRNLQVEVFVLTSGGSWPRPGRTAQPSARPRTAPRVPSAKRALGSSARGYDARGSGRLTGILAASAHPRGGFRRRCVRADHRQPASPSEVWMSGCRTEAGPRA